MRRGDGGVCRSSGGCTHKYISLLCVSVARVSLEGAFRGRPAVVNFPETHRITVSCGVRDYLLAGYGEFPFFYVCNRDGLD